MSAWIAFTLGGLGLLLALASWRRWDRHADQRARRRLLDLAGAPSGVFDPAMVEGLPAPARRYFLYSIAPGAPLHRAVEIEMTGELGLGTRASPGYRAMTARQLLAPPHGLVWDIAAGGISGSDGATPEASWTRMWLFQLIPLLRAGGDADHARSAFGRVVAEAAFWAPASLLPGDDVDWTPLDDQHARVRVRHRGLEQAVTLRVAEDGRPVQVRIQRWSNANPEKRYREQPFGGDLSEFACFDGYRLPTRVEGGNHIGTDAYFPFFRATVTAIRFPDAQASIRHLPTGRAAP
jgi:hypothetical protein